MGGLERVSVPGSFHMYGAMGTARHSSRKGCKSRERFIDIGFCMVG